MVRHCPKHKEEIFECFPEAFSCLWNIFLKNAIAHSQHFGSVAMFSCNYWEMGIFLNCVLPNVRYSFLICFSYGFVSVDGDGDSFTEACLMVVGVV